ncbi:MAG: helix-turn-helix domain-containing protein [Acidobacteriota bacterium]
MSPTNTSKLMTVREVAEILGVRPSRVADLIRRAVLKPVRLGRQIRVAPETLNAFIADGGHTLPGGWRREAQ